MYTINSSVDEPIMLLDRHIGYDEQDGWGIDGALFARELMDLDNMGKKRIQIWINSPGGNVMEAYNIYNAMLKSKTPVDTYCAGIAASAAAVLFQGGRKRIMADYGILMYHNPFGSENTSALQAFRDSIVKMICSRSGMDETACINMMRRETFILASECIEMKLCDEVESSADYNKKRMSAAAATVENNAAGFWKEAKTVFNTLLPNQKNIIIMDFSKIANRLDLIPEANETAILKQIDKIENRATTAEAAVKDIQNKLNEKEAEIVRLNGIVNQHKAEAETAKASADKVEVEAYVNEAISVGRIANSVESKTFWVGQGMKDKDGTKTILENIPVNKQAVKISTTGGGANTGGIKNAAAMAVAKKLNDLQKK